MQLADPPTEEILDAKIQKFLAVGLTDVVIIVVFKLLHIYLQYYIPYTSSSALKRVLLAIIINVVPFTEHHTTP